MATKLARIAELSSQNPNMVFTSIGHLMDVNFLKECHMKMDGDKAVGIDGITKNLVDLVDRLKRKAYKPKPAMRVEIPKDNGKTRSLLLLCKSYVQGGGDTKEDEKEVKTEELSIIASALANGYVKAKSSVVNTSKAVYDAWYDEVYMPPVPAEDDTSGDDTSGDDTPSEGDPTGDDTDPQG